MTDLVKGSSANTQISDQSSKGGVAGIVVYFMAHYGVDPALIALTIPVLAGFFAWLSTRVGDPKIASFIGFHGSGDGKPVRMTAKAPAKAVKKAAAKKPRK